VFVDKLQLIETFDVEIEDCNIYNTYQLIHEIVNMDELHYMHGFYSFISYISFAHSIDSDGDVRWDVVLNGDQFTINYTSMEIK